MASHAQEWKDLLHRDARHGHARSAEFYKKVFGWQNRKRAMAARALTTRWGK